MLADVLTMLGHEILSRLCHIPDGQSCGESYQATVHAIADLGPQSDKFVAVDCLDHVFSNGVVSIG